MEDSLQPYLNRAFHFLKFRQRTEQEVRDYLLRKKAPTDLIERIINKLKEGKFIDDKEFAKWWVDQRNYFKPKGRFVLKQELLKKGIAKELIDELLDNSENNDENSLATKALEKKRPSFEKLEYEERYKKAINFLLRRGFSYDASKKAFEFLWKKDTI